MRKLTQRQMTRYRRERVNALKGFSYAPERLAKNDIYDVEELKDYHAHGDGYLRRAVKSTSESTQNRLRLKIGAGPAIRNRLSLQVKPSGNAMENRLEMRVQPANGRERALGLRVDPPTQMKQRLGLQVKAPGGMKGSLGLGINTPKKIRGHLGLQVDKSDDMKRRLTMQFR
jgi:hypothetical protein